MTTTTESLLLSTGATLNYTTTVPKTKTKPPTLIFLHFWGGSSTTFQNVVQHLSSQYRCLSVSLRGWGASKVPESDDPETFSMTYLAADIRALISALSLSSYILIGHSMGGKVAQLLAGSDLPGLLALILVATAPATPLVMPEVVKAQQLVAYTSLEIARFVATNVLTNPESNLSIDTINLLVEDMLRGSAGAKAAWPSFGILEDVSVAAKRITVPVLVVGATKDTVEPVDRLKEAVLPLLARARIVVVEDSGHLIPVEKPEKLAEVIGEFVGEVISIYITSQPTAWMQANIATLGSRPLRHICIPGSHDAGMYTLTGGTAFSNAKNTQTQTLSIGQQLTAGSRYFDIRPVISGGIYKTGHYSYVKIINSWQGSNGESIADVINDINSFTSGNQELIIINLSHAYDTDAGNSNYPPLTQDQWNALFSQMLGINHLFVAPGDPTTVDLTTMTLSTFIGRSPAVVVIVQPDTPVSLGSYATKGFYTYAQLDAYNNYADTSKLSAMESDQLNKMVAQRTSPNSSYFLLSWTLTQDTAQTLGFGNSILSLASKANAALYTALPPKLSASSYPNILFVDGLTDDGKIVDLAMSINSQFAI